MPPSRSPPAGRADHSSTTPETPDDRESVDTTTQPKPPAQEQPGSLQDAHAAGEGDQHQVASLPADSPPALLSWQQP